MADEEYQDFFEELIQADMKKLGITREEYEALSKTVRKEDVIEVEIPHRGGHQADSAKRKGF